MNVLRLEVSATEADFVVAELYEAGVLGITESGGADGLVLLEAYVANRRDAESLAGRFPEANASIEPADERDWVAHARAQWQPVAVGDRFFLAPDWHSDVAVPEGRIFIPMPAGQGFGSGAHESTQLGLSALEHTAVEGASVLDVGTGSGILLNACHLLGAETLVGCDTDPVAIEAAGEYLRNQAAPHSLYLGSIEAVRPRRFHLVLANLNATLILNLLEDLFAALQPHGRLILSGILREEQDVIHRALGATPGVTRIYHSAQGDWVNFRVTTSVH
ncbi:MAG: 50S ribosomal protein L11 methyltransferase [Bryobacterales bacterium]|nr:50S ribosomal protein L11 methyltransferase [Bryobacterales bacterium]